MLVIAFSLLIEGVEYEAKSQETIEKLDYYGLYFLVISVINIIE